MIAALGKAIAQLRERPMLRVIGKTLLVTIAVFAGLWTAVWSVLANMALSDIGWIDTLIGWLGGALGFVLTLVLFAPVATMAAALFQDEVADAVEARHYPDLPPADGQTVIQAVLSGLRLLIWTIVVNLACLPLYLLPLANILIFFCINGLLLGREYYEAVALRRMDARDAADFRRRHRLRFWAAGIVIAMIFWIPLANFLAPIVGTALSVHVLEAARRRTPAG